MTPERWQQINNLFHSALAREPTERAVFLEHACPNDGSLRREVESMIASHERGEDDFLKAPAIEIAARLFNDSARIGAGQQVGSYRIVGELGVGGMGEVYLAEDSRLGRKVALKFLPESFCLDTDGVNRFEQEARAASALNHPNILTIYEFGQDAGNHYIATEYIDGETLRERIKHGGIEIKEAVSVAQQVAGALVAAHVAGIIHRDIKPENVMVRQDGFIKVLDFGLAKFTVHPALDSESPTRAAVKTLPGTVMGTIGYMSPEQARGLVVDQRTDIWSLGCTLYEMLSGHGPFEGETPSDVLSLILQKGARPLESYRSDIPTELQRIVDKSLAKDREERYQTAKDLLIDLKRLNRSLEIEAELGRTGQPRTTPVLQPEQTQGHTNAETTKAENVAINRRSASAENLIGNLRQHTRGTMVVLVLVAIFLMVATYAYLTPSKTINSLAVLPLVNERADPDTEYLSDGITDSLINSLSQLPNLKVMSLSSVVRYKGKEADARTVGRELNVDAVVTGRLTQRGDGLVISIEMVDVRDNSRIWGSRYDRKLSDLLAVQGEISREVLAKLRTRLTGDEEKRATKRYTENTEAYQLYLKGRYHWNKRTLDDLWKGVDHFQKAIELDPNYALAYSGLADAYFSLLLGGPFAPGSRGPIAIDEGRTKALAAARRAVELDPTLAETHTSLGGVLEWLEWDSAGAEQEYKRALELNPDYATAHHRYGVFLGTAGRSDEGIAELRRAQQLDPASLPINGDLGINYYNALRYDEAIEQLKKTVELDPKWPRAHTALANCYIQKGMYDEALLELQKTPMPGRGAVYARLYILTGRRAEALKILAEMKERAKRQYVSPLALANVYNALGDKEQAFEYLEKAFAERTPGLPNIKSGPLYDDLRSDPRFANLIRRIGLPP